MEHLIFAILGVLALLISLSVHEYSHGLVAYLLGDDTAKRAGRLTLNPLAHIDPIGTVLIPLLGAISGFPLIGWAKPVPFNQYNLKFGKRGPLLVALAGPVSNIVSASVYILLLKFVLEVLRFSSLNLLVLFLFALVLVNLFLGLFNLIPVPPLDGSRIIETILDSPKYSNALLFLQTRGPMILFAILIIDYILPFSPISTIFNSSLRGFFSLFGMSYALRLL